MKKRLLVLAGLLVLCTAAAAGCGKDKQAETESEDVAAVTETPTPTPEEDVVQMEAVSDEDKAAIKNILGEKSSTSSDIVITNETGYDIAEIYIREAADSSDDDWGDELIQGEYEWKDKDRALYYYDKSASAEYDIQVFYTDEEESNCFFRGLDFSDTTEITLRMQDGVPFATYFSTSDKKQISTLREAMERMGMTDSSDSEDEDDDTSVTATPTPSDDEEYNGQTTPAPSDGGDDDGSDPGSEEPGYSNARDEAESYIGKSVGSLQDAIGSAGSVNYEEDPETGAGIGYYEYGDFTVSTAVGEDGQEIVTSVW